MPHLYFIFQNIDGLLWSWCLVIFYLLSVYNVALNVSSNVRGFKNNLKGLPFRVDKF